MGEEEPKKKRVVVESLGWLTESSIMPKKHRAIAGVGPSSIVELKAHLYQSQEENKKSKELSGSDGLEFHRARKIIAPRDPSSLKNSGVEARAHKDKLELKAVLDGTNSYAALEKKAELYDKLVRGELSDEEDKEKYCVDFLQKNSEQNEFHHPQSNESSSTLPPQNHQDPEDGDDGSLLFNTKHVGLGRAVGAKDNTQYKQFVREIHEEANQAREKASELKSRRQEQATARREKLKQAYLRKQLEKLKAKASTEQR